MPEVIETNRRILVIDDNRAIHDDFRKVLEANAANDATLRQAEAQLFGEAARKPAPLGFTVDSAYQGQEGLEQVRQARQAGRPYAVAFVDVRMPPGWDGIETIGHLWKEEPDLQVVICTAYSDYSWDEIARELGGADHLLILKKPFDNIEVRQLAWALTAKWDLLQQSKLRMEGLNEMVQARTAELVTANRKLQGEISERQALESQLLQARKLESIGTLAGGIAHDFNNLLTVITGASDLLLSGMTEGDPCRHTLEQIRKAGDRAARLTQQLLAFGRKQVLQPKVINLNETVREAGKMLQRLIGDHIEMVWHPAPGLWAVRADPVQIEQVLMNLAVNARDAMPKGGKLTVETANVELDGAAAGQRLTVPPGSYVVLSVSDSGCGMDAQVQARIFEPFYTTKEKGKGTGLGLATVYGIVTQSGGHITVHSEPGHGTAFEVYLPRVDAPLEALTPEPAPARVVGGSETVLLAEDQEEVRELVVEVLRGNGYRVLAARDGVEARRVAAENPNPIHLLLTDVVMPQLSGLDLAAELACLRPQLRVLFISGYSENAAAHQELPGVAAHFLPKPFTPSCLLRKVREVLEAVPAGPGGGVPVATCPAG